MGQRSGVFRKLREPQNSHIVNALERTRVEIGAEFLIAENRQALLEAELEPVAAGDAVARPVVEVFVRDHALDDSVVVIGRAFRIGQHEFRVEEIESLVFHRSGIEITDRDDHVGVEVVF